jgi:hypothetical protein
MKFDDLLRRWLLNLNLKVFAMNSRNSLLPNLWCLCKIDINPTVLDFDDQQVTFTIPLDDKILAISAIYASTNYLHRRNLWSALNNLQTQHAFPWCFIGDYNVILGSHEHRGRTLPARMPMTEFQSWTDSFNLFHLPTKGAVFTWNNGRGGARHTEKRLDRAVCNQLWLDTCCVTDVTTLVKHKSDHFPLLLSFQTAANTIVSNFKFHKMWTRHPDCKDLVVSTWNTNVVGCPMYILSQKLKLLKSRLKVWNKESFGNVDDAVRTAEQTLHNIQNNIQASGPTDALLIEEKNVHGMLEEALNRQEMFWQEKAKINWHLNGDRNTKYFHRLVKIKNTTKTITSLQDGDNILTDYNQISDHIINYYKNLFCSNLVLQDSAIIDDVIPSLVTTDVNAISYFAAFSGGN